MEGTHVEIGKQIATKFNLPEKIVNAIEAHHGDVEYTSIEAAIVDAADNISGSRPGARRDTYENYVKRLEDFENLAMGFEGVEKVYAIQAGREIRVFVKPEKVDDWAATKIARDIANKIEQDMKYPGEIRVMVIRETRVIYEQIGKSARLQQPSLPSMRVTWAPIVVAERMISAGDSTCARNENLPIALSATRRADRCRRRPARRDACRFPATSRRRR